MPVLMLPARWQVTADTRERRIATLVEIVAWDAVAGATVTLRAGSHDDARVCHAREATWWPALASLPKLGYDFFSGAFEGQITAPSSSLTLRTEPWPNFARYLFADAPIRLWTGDPDDGSVWVLRFDGRISSQPKIDAGAAQIDFAVDDTWLDAPLLQTYAGTTGAEGPAAMKGQTKPLSLGTPRYASGKLIDSINSVFQLSAYGAIEGFDAALERLARYAAPIADYASYDALVAATIPAGAWATAKAVGMARFGAPTMGQISFLLRGDNSGPNGWARKPGALIRRLALLSGGAGKIDDASLDALDVARPFNLSVQIEEQTTARDMIQQIAASINAVAGMTWTGKLFVSRVAIGAAGLTLAADGSALPPVASVQQIDNAAPWKKLSVGAARTWTVHALADIAFTAPVVDLGPYDPAKTYAEGNIVQNQGTNWLYISPTRSSGNAPPTLPVLSNSWWRAPLAPGTRVLNDATAPVGANVGDIWAPTGEGVIYTWNGTAWIVTSDVTATAQVTTDINRNVPLAADYLGNVDPAMFPITMMPTVTRGGVDIRTRDSTTYGIVTRNVTATVNNTNGSADKGKIEVTALAANSSSIDLTVTVAGVEQPTLKITVSKTVAASPTSGNATAKTATDTSFNSTSSTAFVALSDPLQVLVAAGERLVGTAPLDYYVQGPSSAGRNASAKWQYSAAATGPWTDFVANTAITGSTAVVYNAPDEFYREPGHGDFNQAVSGLAAGVYFSQLVAAISNPSRVVTFEGTATIQAKP